MTDAQMSCPFQAIIIYQSLLLMQCPAVLQQDVVIPAEKEQQLLLQLIQDLLTLEPENSCLLLISELQRERQESSDRKWHVLELQCLRQIELFKNNLSVQELMLDIKKEEKLYHAAAKKFQQLESKNVLEMEDMQERVEDLVHYILEIELAEEAEVLHLAAEYGGPYLTAKLIDAGFSVSGLDGDQRIPLFKAARSGQVETVKLLLERGSDVNARDVEGLSALHAAVFSGSVETVKILIGNGSEIDAASSDSGMTPLLLAASIGYLPVVQELVNSGADFSIRDDEGDNALMTSTIFRHVDVACWLIQNVSDTDIKPNKAGLTPLTQAIHFVNYDIINCLLQNGFPVNLEDDESISPLNAAAVQGNYAVAKILLESGANVNFKDEDGSTPLHLAAYRGNLQVVRLLVAHNADLSAVDVEGRTPEVVAKHNQHFHVARFLRNARKPQN